MPNSEAIAVAELNAEETGLAADLRAMSAAVLEEQLLLEAHLLLEAQAVLEKQIWRLSAVPCSAPSEQPTTLVT